MLDYAMFAVKVTTLTPLHIGNGRELLHEYDYAIRNGRTWRINEDALLDAQPLDDPRDAERLAVTPPAQLLTKPEEFRPDSPFFRYVIKGTPRSSAHGAVLREQIKDPFDRIYLPGSSIKGALRTMLGWYGWEQRKERPEIRRLGRSAKWAATEYEHAIFGRDPNHDLMRALQVSDSSTAAADRLLILNARVMGRGGKMGSPIEVEAIRSDTAFELSIKLDRALYSDWAGQNRLVGGEWLEELPQIARAYMDERLNQEVKWFEAIPGARQVADFYRQFARTTLGRNAFLVQAGWGAGWDAKTFGSRLTADGAFMERIIVDYRMAKGARRTGDPFPKSRRVAVSFNERAESPAAPLGWLHVEMKER